MLAIVDLDGIDVNTEEDDDPFEDPARVRRTRISSYGVRPADLLLDPDADLSITSTSDEDVLYIAGGIMGLWAMRADVSSTGTNPTVRVDDAQSATGTPQDSTRFCNQLATAVIGDETYLIATLGYSGGGSVLRFYEISRIRALLAPTLPAETGNELAPDLQIVLGSHSNFPSASNTDSKSHAYPLGIAIDQGNASGTGEFPTLYLAMGTHGLLRLTPSDSRDSNGFTTTWTKNWGPMFGNGSPYQTTNGLGQLEDNKDTYKSIDFRTMGKQVEFNDISRSEPPLFTDVAVQNETGEHYLYCTVDHLNWVRFELGSTSNPWSYQMAIDHHEGESVAIPTNAVWHNQNGVPATSSYGSQSRTVRPLDFPPFDSTGSPTDPMMRDTTFAHGLQLIEVPDGRTLLVVTSATTTMHQRFFPILTPSPNYNSDWSFIGGVQLATAAHMLPKNELNSLIVYDTAQLSATFNGLGYMTAGGISLFVPPDQSQNGQSSPPLLKIFHNLVYADPSNDSQGQETCLTFYGIKDPSLGGTMNHPQGSASTVFIRRNDSPETKGRFTHGLAYNIVDPRILVTGHNDAKVQMDGILWAEETGGTPSTDVEIQLVTASPSGEDDRRMDAGLIAPQNNQWSSTTQIGTGYTPSSGTVFHFMAGEGKTKDYDASPTDPTIHNSWCIVQHEIKPPASGTAAADLNWRRGLSQPLDRWGKTGRLGTYFSGTTTPAAFTTWATGNPSSYVFFTRAHTADNLVVADRSQLLTWLALHFTSPFRKESFHLWPTTAQQSGVPNQFSLNCHPEWDLVPEAPQGGTASSAWWLANLFHQGNSIAWAPIMLDFPIDLSSASTPTREWILAVPCFTLSNPHLVEALELAGSTTIPQGPEIDLDAAFADWMDISNLSTNDPESYYLLDHYTHGLVQFWRFTDQPAGEYPEVTGEPDGSSDLPFIVLPDANTSAFRLASATVGSGSDTKVLLFVADFGGHLYMYDVSNLPDEQRSATGFGAPDATWTAPPSFYEPALHSNVRCIAVDVVDDNHIDAYVGVPGYGIAIVDFEYNTTSQTWSADPNPVERIETPGGLYDVKIRDESGLQKLLLVSDGLAGLRIYGEE